MKISALSVALGLAVAAIAGKPAAAQQQGPTIGYIPLNFASVAFIADCNGVRVNAGLELHYEDANDAYRQLYALYPQCRFLQIQLAPVPLPPAPPSR